MALSKAGLKTDILTELQAQGFVITGTYAWSQKFAEAVANAVVDHITTNAVVQTTSGAPNGEHTGNVT